MIEITKLEEIKAIESAKIRIYLKKRLREVGFELNPLTEGSFLYVEDPGELEQSHKLQGVTLPSIEQGLFSNIETITADLDIFEISLLFNNEYLLSLIIYSKNCSETFLQQLGVDDFNEI